MAGSGVDVYSTIGDMLDRQVERFADRDALVQFRDRCPVYLRPV